MYALEYIQHEQKRKSPRRVTELVNDESPVGVIVVFPTLTHCVIDIDLGIEEDPLGLCEYIEVTQAHRNIRASTASKLYK